jgi:hypothetical protein
MTRVEGLGGEQQRHDAPLEPLSPLVVRGRTAPRQRSVEGRIALSFRHLHQRPLDGAHLDVVVGRRRDLTHEVVLFVGVPVRLEVLVRDQLGTGALTNALRRAVVVGM